MHFALSHFEMKLCAAILARGEDFGSRRRRALSELFDVDEIDLPLSGRLILDRYVSRMSRQVQAASGLSRRNVVQLVGNLVADPENPRLAPARFLVQHSQGSGKSHSIAHVAALLAEHRSTRNLLFRVSDLEKAASEPHIDEPDEPSSWVVVRLRPLQALHHFLERLIMMGQRADGARMSRLALAAKARRTRARYRSAEPPGHVVTSSRRPPRGPDRARMTSVLIMRGEPVTLA